MEASHLTQEELDYELKIRGVHGIRSARTKLTTLRGLIEKENRGNEKVPKDTSNIISSEEEIEACNRIYDDILESCNTAWKDKDLLGINCARTRFNFLQMRLERIRPETEIQQRKVYELLDVVYDAIYKMENTISYPVQDDQTRDEYSPLVSQHVSLNQELESDNESDQSQGQFAGAQALPLINVTETNENESLRQEIENLRRRLNEIDIQKQNIPNHSNYKEAAETNLNRSHKSDKNVNLFLNNGIRKPTATVNRAANDPYYLGYRSPLPQSAYNTPLSNRNEGMTHRVSQVGNIGPNVRDNVDSVQNNLVPEPDANKSKHTQFRSDQYRAFNQPKDYVSNNRTYKGNLTHSLPLQIPINRQSVQNSQLIMDNYATDNRSHPRYFSQNNRNEFRTDRDGQNFRQLQLPIGDIPVENRNAPFQMGFPNPTLNPEPYPQTREYRRLGPHRAETLRKSVPINSWRISFSGDSRGIHLHEFLVQLKMLQRSENVSDEEMLFSIVHLLTGRAKLWFASTHNRYATWEQFEQALKREFLPDNYDFVLLSEISSRTQKPDESGSEFITQMQATFSCISFPISEEYKLFMVKKNLTSKYAMAAATARVRNLDELCDVCREIDGISFKTRQSLPFQSYHVFNNSARKFIPERELNELQQVPFVDSIPSGELHFEGQYSENAMDNEVCAVRTYDRRFRGSQQTNSPQNVSSGNAMLCWNCRKNGHLWQRCSEPRSNRKFCYTCGHLNVTVHSCPKCSGNEGRITADRGTDRNSENNTIPTN